MSRLITVATFDAPLEARIFQGLLASFSITSWVHDDNMIGMQWTLSVALGGVKVAVTPREFVPASEIRERYYAGDFTTPEEDPANNKPCLQAMPSRRQTPAWLIGIVACWALTGVVFPLPRRN